MLALSPTAEDETIALEGTTPISVRDIADTVDGLLGPITVEHIPARAADYTGTRVSNAKAKRLLGWSPTTGFTEGVRRYAEWYRAETALRQARRPQAMPHALLLSGSLGQGHDVMAAACADSLHERGWTTATVDAMALLGRRSGAAGEAVFRRLLAVPGVYDAFHFSALRPGTRLARSTERAAVARLAPRVRDLLGRQPTELVVSVFSTAAGAVDALSRDGAPVPPHMVFCTDVTPHRLWVHESTDLFLVTSETAAAGVRRYRPDARTVVTPAPLRTPFYSPPTKQAARGEFGIPPDARCVLLIRRLGPRPGGRGGGRARRGGLHVLAVAGRNRELEARLREVRRREPRVRALGYPTGYRP